MEDVDAWFRQPFTGTVETGAAPWWRLAGQYEPRVVVVRRQATDVVESLMRVAPFDRVGVTKLVARLDRKLDQIERRVPDVLSVSFEDLASEETCARIFEYCLPYQHDPLWWSTMASLNLQINIPALLRYCRAYGSQTEKLRQTVQQLSLDKLHRGPGFLPSGMTISEEPFDAYFPGALDEIRRHSVEIGEGADYPDQMNFEMMKAHADAGCLQTVIARSNGRVFGYLLTVLQPCFVDKGISAAHHTSVWASSEFRGLGLRMYRVSNDLLRQKGYGEIIFRAGVRGDGPRLGALFRRLGAHECGQLYRLGTAA
jgi:hypothetical protein